MGCLLCLGFGPWQTVNRTNQKILNTLEKALAEPVDQGEVEAITDRIIGLKSSTMQ